MYLYVLFIFMKLVGQNGSCNKWIKFKFVWLLFFVTLLTQQIEHTNTFYSHNQKVPSVHTEEKLQSLWEELTWRHFRCLVFVFLGRLYNYLFGIGQHTWNMHEVFVISDTSFNSCCFCFFKLIVKQYKDNSQNIPGSHLVSIVGTLEEETVLEENIFVHTWNPPT